MISYRLYRRPESPYWVLEYRVDGHAHRRSTKRRKKIDAEQSAKVFIQGLEQRIFAQGKNYRLSELCLKYLRLAKIQNRESYVKNKTYHLREFAKVFTADPPLSMITPELAQEFISGIAAKSKITANRFIATLHHLFETAIEWDMLDKNPFRKIRKFRESGRQRYFTDAELDRLLQAAREISTQGKNHIQKQIHHIILFALYTGCRLSEILQARWFDIRDGFLQIRQETAKSGKTRLVPIHPELMRVLQSRDLSQGDEYIFQFPVRRASDIIRNTWHQICTRTKVKDVHFHDLRHSFSSRLAAAGVDMGTLREILGHGSLAMTQHYSHSTAAAKMEAVKKIKF